MSTPARVCFLDLARELRDEIYHYYLTASHELIPAIGNRYASPRPDLADALSTGPARSLLLVCKQVKAEYEEELLRTAQLVGKFIPGELVEQPLVCRPVYRRIVADRGFAARLQCATFFYDCVKFGGIQSAASMRSVARAWCLWVDLVLQFLPNLRTLNINVVSLCLNLEQHFSHNFAQTIKGCLLDWARQKTYSVVVVSLIPGVRIDQRLSYLGLTTHVIPAEEYVLVNGSFQHENRFGQHMGTYIDFYDEIMRLCSRTNLEHDPTAMSYNAARAAFLDGYRKWVRAGMPWPHDLLLILISQDNEDHTEMLRMQGILTIKQQENVQNDDTATAIWEMRRAKILEEYGDVCWGWWV